MRKFEKLPESKVIFNADVAVMVRSEVPGSEPSLMQCFTGEGQWGAGHVGGAIGIHGADLARHVKHNLRDHNQIYFFRNTL